MPRRVNPVVIVVLLFATVGLYKELREDSIGLFFTVAIWGMIVYAFYHFTKTGRLLPRFFSKPTVRKAVKKSSTARHAKPAKKRSHLHVIEGSKGKTSEKNNDEPNVYH